MTDALVPLDVEALTALPLGEQVGALTAAYRGWRRVDTQVAWGFGRGLCAVRGNYSKGSGDWGRVLDTIGIEHSKARRFMRIAEHDAVEIARHLTVDAAYKALPAKRPVKALKPAHGNTVVTGDGIPVAGKSSTETTTFPDPAAVSTEPTPAPSETTVRETAVSTAEAMVGEVVEAEEADASRERAELREQIVERWALRTEHESGTEIERLHRLLDRADARDRDRVATITAGRKREQAKDRKDRHQCDAALLLPPSPERDAFLARFWNVACKAA